MDLGLSDLWEGMQEETLKVAEQTPAQGIELKLATGEVIKAANYEEALKVAVQMTENTKKVYQEEKAARERLEAQVGTLSQQVETLQRPKPQPQDGKFSNDEYFRLLNSDPIGAANYLDAHRLGIERPELVPQRFNEMYTGITEMQGQSLAGMFLQQHSDFPQTPEAGRLLSARVKELAATGHPSDLNTMNMAWQDLLSEDKIKPLEQKEQEREEPNPDLRGSGSGVEELSVDEEVKLMNMPAAELEAYMRQKGVLK